MTSKEIRQKFLEFFANKGHEIVPSASLIPDDPTLLLTVAGMVPFKPIFLGLKKTTFSRATSCQKCVRTNDIENVGKTARHQTFFEMLGNFSFGDYFKKEVIPWAWEFLTKELGLPKDKLWISVYLDDDEAYAIWRDDVGISEDRIMRMGDEDNFWAAGPVGPCGPCSEIYIDLGESRGCGSADCKPGCDCDRYLEIWNLVFMQYSRDEEGNLTPLPRRNIDTGMGLERIASVLQKVNSNFETDLFVEIMDYVSDKAKLGGEKTPQQDLALRIIADHARAVTFLISDGVLPSNEGRGYVLRRIMRRALRYGWLLNLPPSFFHEVMAVVIAQNKEVYQDLLLRKEHILRVAKIEEERFQETLGQGMEILQNIIAEAKEKGLKEISGQQAFKLHDTYGFPLELTQEIAGEQGFTVDEEKFKSAMEEQRNRARAAREDVRITSQLPIFEKIEAEHGSTKYVGYGQEEITTKVVAIVKNSEVVESAEKGDQVEIILAASPFYGESGGQVGDKGVLEGEDFTLAVTTTKKPKEGMISHLAQVVKGKVGAGAAVLAKVNNEARMAASRNHTATHLLHQALKEILGEHVEQAGSLVNPERLRFDFSHFAAVSKEELQKIEDRVNEKVLAALPIEICEVSLEEAKKKGATALFGEKYGEVVRMVQIGDYSLELCGGTHLVSSSQVGMFKILSETGIAAGVRRIEAVTGKGALLHIQDEERILAELGEKLKGVPKELVAKLDKIMLTMKEQEKELNALKNKLAKSEGEEILKQIKEVEGIKVLRAAVDNLDGEGLRNMADLLRDKLGSGVVVLATVDGEKVMFVATVTKDLISKGLHAGNIVKEVAKAAGGGGGGRPDMAQAGGKDSSKTQSALDLVESVIEKQLKK